MASSQIQLLVQRILAGYGLNPRGIHGLAHWARVHEFGRRLARETDADPAVISFFALFHDSRRENDSVDSRHGPRGAALARQLHGSLFELSSRQFELLCQACDTHTSGHPRDMVDITVKTCWDADRLDLARVGKTPDPKFLSTEPAKSPELIRWAMDRSMENWHPPILETWLGREDGFSSFARPTMQEPFIPSS